MIIVFLSIFCFLLARQYGPFVKAFTAQTAEIYGEPVLLDDVFVQGDTRFYRKWARQLLFSVILCLLVSGFWTQIVAMLGFSGSVFANESVDALSGGFSLFLAGVLTCLIMPYLETILCFGLLPLFVVHHFADCVAEGILNRRTSEFLGYVLGVFGFLALHLIGIEPSNLFFIFISYFGVGWFFAWLMIRTQSVQLVFWTHAFYNFVLLALMILRRG